MPGLHPSRRLRDRGVLDGKGRAVLGRLARPDKKEGGCLSALLPTGLEAEVAEVFETELRAELKNELLSLSYRAFEECMKRLLLAMGYEEVKALGRIHRRGRTRHGGAELAASSRTGVTRSLLALQLKQYTRPVSRRFVDELRGACVRLGAEQGLIVTTSGFSRAARKAALTSSPARIRLVDGEELLDRLLLHGIGTKGKDPAQHSLDTEFFTLLCQQYPSRTPAAASSNHSSQSSSEESSAPSPVHPSQSGSRESSTTSLTSHKMPDELQAPAGRKDDEMMWRTHVLFGISSLWPMTIVPGAVDAYSLAPLVALAAFGSLLPDLDAEESKVKYLSVGGIRPFAPISSLIYHAWGHRGPLHSLSGLAVVGGLGVGLSFWWGWQASLAFFLGYGSHLAADACTRTGIPLLYPRKRRYFLLLPNLRFVTGSQAEDLLFPFLAASVLLLLLAYLPRS